MRDRKTHRIGKEGIRECAGNRGAHAGHGVDYVAYKEPEHQTRKVKAYEDEKRVEVRNHAMGYECGEEVEGVTDSRVVQRTDDVRPVAK